MAEHRTPGFLRYFIIGEHFERFVVPNWQGDLYGSGRARLPGTIWLFGLLAALPWSAVLLAALFQRKTRQAVFSRALIFDPWLSYLLLWILAPLILFTPAKNILVTYAATALPGFALLTAHALERLVARPAAIAATAAIVPVVFVIGIVVMNFAPQSAYLASQAPVIAAYQKAKPAGSDFELVYIFNKPYSADFYSGGRATLAKNDEELAQILRGGGKPYFVIAPEMLARLSPDTQKRFETVGAMNDVLLLRAKGS
jgi:4-amino-4-deoxy-L-arabinose transferase-like glycosyltransferase